MEGRVVSHLFKSKKKKKKYVEKRKRAFQGRKGPRMFLLFPPLLFFVQMQVTERLFSD